MPKGILVVAAVIVAVMVGVKDGWLPRLADVTGLTGSCAIVQTLTDGTQLEACRPGKLEGAPRLDNRGCAVTGETGPVQYWRCPAALATSQADR